MILFSIIIPAYNAEWHIASALESCVHQKCVNGDNLEIIVVDDGSFDDSSIIVNEWRQRYSQITLIQQQKNCGVAIARTVGLQAAKGSYLLFLDADDQLADNCLSFWGNVIKQYPEADILAGDIRCFLDSSRKTFVLKAAGVNGTGLDFLRWISLGTKGNGYLAGKVFRRELWKNIPTNQMTYCEDLLLLFHMALRIRSMVYFSHCVYEYNFNESSVTNRNISRDKHSQRLLTVFQELNTIAISPEVSGEESEIIKVKKFIFGVFYFWYHRYRRSDRRMLTELKNDFSLFQRYRIHFSPKYYYASRLTLIAPRLMSVLHTLSQFVMAKYVSRHKPEV